MSQALLCCALIAVMAGCKSGEKKESVPPPESTGGSEIVVAAPEAPADAGARPERAQAKEALEKFSQGLLDNDTESARMYLHIPTGYSDKQVEYFLQELRAPEHLSAEGVGAVLEADFGPLKERFGEQAQGVAESLELPIERVYAFGDTDAAALLLWDGKDFRVAALHRLAKPKPKPN